MCTTNTVDPVYAFTFERKLDEVYFFLCDVNILCIRIRLEYIKYNYKLTHTNRLSVFVKSALLS